MYWVRISDMKINQEMKRKIVQVAAFLATRIHILEISYQVRFTKEDGNSSAIPAGTLEGGIAICGLLNKVSIYHMECNKKTCVSCGKCHNICPMDVDPVKNPNSAECIRCGKCVASCPKESLALKFVYGKKG